MGAINKPTHPIQNKTRVGTKTNPKLPHNILKLDILPGFQLDAGFFCEVEVVGGGDDEGGEVMFGFEAGEIYAFDFVV